VSSRTCIYSEGQSKRIGQEKNKKKRIIYAPYYHHDYSSKTQTKSEEHEHVSAGIKKKVVFLRLHIIARQDPAVTERT
jgi:hypothetical protein